MSSDTLTVLDAVQTEFPITITRPKPKRPPPIPGADICGDRAQGVWRRFLGGEPTNQTFDFAVMTNVQFERTYRTIGCGGEFSGHAIGELTLGAVPSAEQLARARRLRFYACDGSFADRDTGMPLHQVSALFLFEGLRAAYIP